MLMAALGGQPPVPDWGPAGHALRSGAPGPSGVKAHKIMLPISGHHHWPSRDISYVTENDILSSPLSALWSLVKRWDVKCRRLLAIACTCECGKGLVAKSPVGAKGTSIPIEPRLGILP